MKPRNHDFSQPVLTRAVQLALLAMFAAPGLAAAQAAPGAPADPAAKQQAADQAAKWAQMANGEGDATHLICPDNYIELGLLGVSRSAPKFGEYNGLEKSGGYGVGHFDFSGGSGYCARGGALRWNVFGKDLGTTSRSLGATVQNQGRWTIGIGYDQLRHYTTTGYQTPYQGSAGDNVFTLPPGFGVINTVNATAGGGTQALTAAQLAAFHTVNVYNQRQNATFNAAFNFNTEWNAKFDYKHIEMSGGKLTGASSDTANLTALGGLSYRGQQAALLINPTKGSIDNFNLEANWVGKDAYATLGYYGSIYHDAYSGLSWSMPFITGGTAAAPDPLTGASPGSPFPVNTLSTPPSNLFQQLNFTGGYFISPATRLTGGLSLGLNTQNASYGGTYTPGNVVNLPASSLHGRVITKHADARLTHQFTPALNLNVGLRYNERDNNTPVNTYQFFNLATSPVAAAGAAAPVPTSVVNAPMSNRTENVDATLAWRIDKQQKVSLGYAYDRIERWCNSAAANNAQGALPANGAGYYVTASCAQVPKSGENRFNLNYRRAVWDGVDVNLGYTYADRKATVNPSFYNPMQSFNQGFENYGWRAFFQASRRENLFKARVGWQVTDKLNLGLSGQYTQDDYTDSALGVQSGKSSNVNLDATYAVNDDISFGAYLSLENRSRDLTTASDRNPVAPPVNIWTNSLTDRDTAIGINGKQKLMHGKLELAEDLSYGYGNTRWNTALGPNIAPVVGNNGDTPPLNTRLLQFRLSGSYKLDKHSSVGGGWLFQRLRSNDYLYNGYQYGSSATTIMPNNMTSPNYTVNVVYLVYRYTF